MLAVGSLGFNADGEQKIALISGNRVKKMVSAKRERCPSKAQDKDGDNRQKEKENDERKRVMS